MLEKSFLLIRCYRALKPAHLHKPQASETPIFSLPDLILELPWIIQLFDGKSNSDQGNACVFDFKKILISGK
ncbi:MAG: hypothetical protein HN758_07275 [Verrucomicrobia bacterium]|nr:hypothetical protein [Verrucomicrobiota bacterium]